MAKAKKAARKPAKSRAKTAARKAASKPRAKASVMRGRVGGASSAQVNGLKGHVSKLDHKVAALDEKIARVSKKVNEVDRAAGQGFEIVNSRLSVVENGLRDLDAAVGNVLSFSGGKGRANIAKFN